MSIEFCEALTARFAEISSARAVVMTATGRTFSAGVDLVRLLEGGAPYVRKFLPVLSEMFATVFSHPAPVVAAINGHAIAGGCVLACAADKRLMARDGGRIGATELLVGVPFPPAAVEILRCAAGAVLVMPVHAARPCSRSAMMSSLSSSPIEGRTSARPAPAWLFWASVSWR